MRDISDRQPRRCQHLSAQITSNSLRIYIQSVLHTAPFPIIVLHTPSGQRDFLENVRVHLLPRWNAPEKDEAREGNRVKIMDRVESSLLNSGYFVHRSAAVNSHYESMTRQMYCFNDTVDTISRPSHLPRELFRGRSSSHKRKHRSLTEQLLAVNNDATNVDDLSGAWSTDQLADWLVSIGMSKHVPIFISEGVRGHELEGADISSFERDLRLPAKVANEILKAWNARQKMERDARAKGQDVNVSDDESDGDASISDGDASFAKRSDDDEGDDSLQNDSDNQDLEMD